MSVISEVCAYLVRIANQFDIGGPPGKMEARELHPAAEGALREWPIDRRVNKADVGDDDPLTIEPLESDLL